MKLSVIVGGQAGSEGKGAVAGHLAATAQTPMCIRVAGPNAGHTVVGPDGTRYPLRQIPVGAVTNPDAYLGIAAGSEIDLDVLHDEVKLLEDHGINVRDRMIIDPAATILQPLHVEQERDASLVDRIGSTGKGIGAARAARIMRQAVTVRDIQHDLPYRVSPVAEMAVARGRDIHVEGTQGYMLGLHTHWYPQVTSSDCTALDFLGMARLNPWQFTPEQLNIWIVYRPYPIRVAGNSGPMEGETTWQELGLEQERTTVTKKIRRVGRWDGPSARAAAEANGWLPGSAGWGGGLPDPRRYALTMADQLDPDLAGVTKREPLMTSGPYQRFLTAFIQDVGAAPHMVTTSDRTCIWPRPAV